MFRTLTPNLMVEDVGATIKFYQDVLGMTVITSQKNESTGELESCLLTTERGLMLMLQQRTSLIEDYPTLETEAVQPSLTLYIQVAQLDEFYNEINARCPIYVDYHTTKLGAEEFAIQDNNGYVLVFTEFK